MSDALVLTVNSGSSSIKAALYRVGGDEALVVRGQLDRIGIGGGRFQMADGAGKSLEDWQIELPDHDAALRVLFDWLQSRHGGDLSEVGHRIFLGGTRNT